MLQLLSGELGDLVRPIRVQQVLRVEEGADEVRPLLRLDDNTPWLMQLGGDGGRDDVAIVGGGPVLFMASPPDPTWTNLPLMPLMVPLIQEVLRQGVAEGGADSRVVVAGRAFAAPGGVEEVFLTRDRGERLRAAATEARTMTVRQAGVWRGGDGVGRAAATIAANPDVDGARTGALDRDAVRVWLAGAQGAGSEAQGAVRWIGEERDGGSGDRDASSSPFDLPLLVGVLLLAIAEMVLARWASHAGVWRQRVAPLGAGEGA